MGILLWPNGMESSRFEWDQCRKGLCGRCRLWWKQRFYLRSNNRAEPKILEVSVIVKDTQWSLWQGLTRKSQCICQVLEQGHAFFSGELHTTLIRTLACYWSLVEIKYLVKWLYVQSYPPCSGFGEIYHQIIKLGGLSSNSL